MARVGDITRGETEPQVTSELRAHCRGIMDACLHNNLKPKKQEQDEHPLVYMGAMRPESSRIRWPVMVGPFPA